MPGCHPHARLLAGCGPDGYNIQPAGVHRHMSCVMQRHVRRSSRRCWRDRWTRRFSTRPTVISTRSPRALDQALLSPELQRVREALAALGQKFGGTVLRQPHLSRRGLRPAEGADAPLSYRRAVHVERERAVLRYEAIAPHSGTWWTARFRWSPTTAARGAGVSGTSSGKTATAPPVTPNSAKTARCCWIQTYARTVKKGR